MILILGIIIGLLICVIVALVLSYKITFTNFINDLDALFKNPYSYVSKNDVKSCIKINFGHYPEKKEEK